MTQTTLWKFSPILKNCNIVLFNNQKKPLLWPISPSSCKFSFAEHSITVLYAKPVKLIKEHINFLYFTTSFNMIPTMVLKQVLDKFCMSIIFPELKNLKLFKCIIQSSSFIHLCKRQISLASVGQILFGLEKKSLMVKSVLLTCPNLFNYKLLNLLLSMIFSLLKFEIHNFGLDATPNIIRKKTIPIYLENINCSIAESILTGGWPLFIFATLLENAVMVQLRARSILQFICYPITPNPLLTSEVASVAILMELSSHNHLGTHRIVLPFQRNFSYIV